jgi:hypothetical protein
MNIQDWGAIGEVVSAVAVIITLVYLALQLRQNTKALRSSAAWDAETIWGAVNIEHMRHPENALLLTRAASDTAKMEDFSETEVAQLYFAMRGGLQYAQAQWWLWKGGSLPDEIWEMRRNWAKNFIQPPVMNSIWRGELGQHVLTEEFVQDILSADPGGKLAYSPITETE